MTGRFHSHTAVAADGSVLSRQTYDASAAATTSDTAAAAGDLYWAFLTRFGRGLLRITPQPDHGVAISALGITLLRFEPPVIHPLGEGVAIRYPVGYGLAVHPRHRAHGYLQMGLEPGRLSLEVAGYYPTLGSGSWLYNQTQSRLHVRIAEGYLSALAHHLSLEE